MCVSCGVVTLRTVSTEMLGPGHGPEVARSVSWFALRVPTAQRRPQGGEVKYKKCSNTCTYLTRYRVISLPNVGNADH